MKIAPKREWGRSITPRGRTTPGRAPWQRLLPSEISLRIATDTTFWFLFVLFGAVAMGASVPHGAVAGGTAAALQVLLGTAAGLYRGRWRISSFEEAVALSSVVLTVSVILALVVGFASVVEVTLAVGLFAPFSALSGMLFSRGVRRLVRQRSRRAKDDLRKPVIVFGAGDAGAQIIKAMLGNDRSTYQPVALLDDDPAKQNLRIRCVPVVVTRKHIAAVAKRTKSELLVIAAANIDAQTVQVLETSATRAGLEVRVLPPTQELIDGVVGLADLREVTEGDLLGRRIIDTDINAIASYLSGARVLVTGAGGSIGSELCRQIARFDPAELVMVDRDESALHAVQLSIEGRALLDSRNIVVADIRDGERIREVFGEHSPQVVFHAAALKHLPLLEMYPEEGWKTNVLGTNNVLGAAAQVGVSHFVNVSTDKAAAPTSVLGYTKRLAEQLTSWYANRSRGDWVSVRFGNVLGSRGSMLEAFRAQAARGGPITVTDPDVTRYFMTPQEACQLVIQAGAIGHRGEALVLDMGEPVRILDVAQRLADAAPTPVDIVFTGLRQGEKLHEDLISTGELDVRRAHPLISHVMVPPLRPTMLGLFDQSSADAARRSMSDLCDGSASTPIVLG